MTELTIDRLPEELILDEILSFLDLKDALSFCTISISMRRICGNINYWTKRFLSLTYQELQQSVLYWSSSGRCREIFYQVFPLLLSRLDMRTAACVYLYSLEQRLYPEALIVRRQSLEFFGSRYENAEQDFFGASSTSYIALLDLLNAMRRADPSEKLDQLFVLAFNRFGGQEQPNINRFITEYIVDRLVTALTDSEMVALYRSLILTLSRLGTALLPGIVRRGRGTVLMNNPVTIYVLLSPMLTHVDLKQLHFDMYGKEINKSVPFRTKDSVVAVIRRGNVEMITASFMATLLEPEELTALYPNNSPASQIYYQQLMRGCIDLGYTDWMERLAALADMK